MKNRANTTLKVKLEHQLLAYATAATAAGMGVTVADAKVIYTPAHLKIVRNPGFYNFDVNHDGSVDFAFTDSSSCDIGGCSFTLGLFPRKFGNAVVFNNVYSRSAAALRRGASVDVGQNFISSRFGQMAAVYYSTSGGNRQVKGQWINVARRYLGLRFLINGETHYGWARLNVSVHGKDITALLTGYAYETVPDKAIVAGNRGRSVGAVGPGATPQAASLGQLALGSSDSPKLHEHAVGARNGGWQP